MRFLSSPATLLALCALLSGGGLYRAHQVYQAHLYGDLSFAPSQVLAAEAEGSPAPAPSASGALPPAVTSRLPALPEPYQSIRWREGSEKHPWQSGDLAVRDNGTLQLKNGSVTESILARHVLESWHIDTGSINSRTIENGTIEGEDIASDAILTLAGVDVAGLRYQWPSSHVQGILTNDGGGTLSWETLGASNITPDSLDFSELADSLTLDANLSIASGSNYSIDIDSGTLFVDTANNRVGIGDTSPAALLTVGSGDLFQVDATGAVIVASSVTVPTVSGSASASGQLLLQSTSHATKGTVFFGSTSGVAVSDANNRIHIGTNGASVSVGGQEGRIQIAGNSNNNSALTLVRNANNPNVGYARIVLGASRNSGSTDVTALQSGDFTGGIEFAGADGSTLNTRTAQILSAVDGSVATGIAPGRLTFGTANTSGTLTERLRIDSAGNVGIGDTSPDDLLNIHSASAQAALALTSLGTDTDTLIKFEFSDGTPTFTMGVDDSDSDKFKIEAATSLGGATPAFVIDSSGNVGVGTASPGATFDVSGSIFARGTQPLTLYDSQNQPSLKFGPLSSTDDQNAIITSAQNIAFKPGVLRNGYGDLQVNLSSSGGTSNFEIGNDSGNTQLAGTYDSYFKVQGDTGNVGVGTASPGYRLEVSGGDDIAFFDGSNAGYIRVGRDSSNYLRLGVSSANVAQVNAFANIPLTFSTNNTEWVRITNGGNVGIGTTSPSGNLDIYASAPKLVLSASQDASDPEIQLVRASNPTTNGMRLWYDNSASGLYLDNYQGGGNIYLRTKTASAPVDALTILSGGNVGIGDTSPDDLLNIHSASAQAALALTSLGTDTDALIKFELSDGTPSFTMGVDDSDSDKFKISTTALGTSDRFVIDSSGNLGIGTASPGTLLDVVDGQARVANFSTITYSSLTWAGRDRPTLELVNRSADGYRSGLHVYTSGQTSGGFLAGPAASNSAWSAGATARDTANYFTTETTASAIRQSGGSFLFQNGSGLTVGAQVALTELMRLSSAGFLGIGDTSPDDLLNIHSASAQVALALTSLGTDTDALIKFEFSDGTPTFTMGVDDSDSDKFKISTTALGTSDRFVIDSSGNVGVGTATVNHRLSVWSAGAANTTMELYADTGNTAWSVDGTEWYGKLLFGSSDTSGAGAGERAAILAQPGTGGSGGARSALTFWTKADSDSAVSERFRIDYQGNVGIATTTPDSPLTVIGNVTIDQDAGFDAAPTISLAIGDTDTGFNWVSDGVLTWYADNVERLRLENDGDLLLASTASGVGASNLCWDGSGSSYWGACTSLKKYKDNVEPLTLGLSTLMALRPVEFDWNHRIGAHGHDLGFIAEEVAAVNPLLAEYGGEDGALSGVKYNLLTSLIVRSVQEQQGNILALDTRSTASLSDIQTLQGSLTPLEALLQDIEDEQADQDVLLSALSDRLDLHEENLAVLTDFYATFDLGNFLATDAQGNVSLDGALRAEILETGELAIEVVDEEAPTIGQATLEAGETSIIIESNAADVQSRIFVTPRVGDAGFTLLGVQSVSPGEGFTVAVPEALGENLVFDWWIVQER